MWPSRYIGFLLFQIPHVATFSEFILFPVYIYIYIYTLHSYAWIPISNQISLLVSERDRCFHLFSDS